MLYNIVPPLIFFGSFGGILVILSRIVLRAHRQQVATAIHAEVAGQQSVPENLLTPAGSGLTVMKSRLQVLSRNIKETTAATVSSGLKSVSALKEMKKEIVMPGSGWSEKITGSLASLRTKTQALTIAVIAKLHRRPAPAQVVVEDIPTPEIRVSRSEKIAEVTEPAPIPEEAAPVAKAALATSKNFMAQFLQREESPSVYDQAARALAVQDYQRVEDILVPFILEHAQDAQAYMMLGRAAFGRGNYADAVEIFQQVIKLNSQEPGAQAALGLAAFKEGKFTVAVQALQRARDAGGADREVLISLLSIAQHMDNRVLQRSLLQELIDTQPDSQEYLEALAALQKSQAEPVAHR